MDYRRIGRFHAPEDWVLDQERHRSEMETLLDGCVTVAADWDWHSREFVYTAIHPDFDIHESHAAPPMYEAVASDGARTWRRGKQ